MSAVERVPIPSIRGTVAADPDLRGVGRERDGAWGLVGRLRAADHEWRHGP